MGVRSLWGCRPQYVCLYTGKPGAHPSGPHTDYKYYGFDNFSNVLHEHWIVNNQTGGAKVYPCRGYGGTRCKRYRFFDPAVHRWVHYVPAGEYVVRNFTPINSIRLTP